MRKGSSADASEVFPFLLTCSSRMRGGARPIRPRRFSSNAAPVVGSCTKTSLYSIEGLLSVILMAGGREKDKLKGGQRQRAG